MRRALAVTLLLVLVLCAQAAHAWVPPVPPPADDYDLFFDQVELGPGVTSDIHVKVFVNDEQPRFGKTVFAIPGLTCTAAIWDEYAEALFTHPFKGVRTSRLVAIDLPGHGESTPPADGYFGYLSLDDYVTAILATLDRLRGCGIYPQEIIGFSQGGLLVQMLQERLVEGGSSLFREYGIFRAVLLASCRPMPLYQEVEQGNADSMLGYFFHSDGGLGPHFEIDAMTWWYVFFANLDGDIPQAWPTPDDIIARGYQAPAPLVSTMQLFNAEPPGLPLLPRPAVSPDIFGLASGTLLHVVSFQDDPFQGDPLNNEELFHYLVGSPWFSRNTVVCAEDDVHDRVHMLPITNPSVIIDAMSEHGWFVW